MVVGAAAAIAVGRLWANGWLETLYAPAHRLAYPGLEWIPPLDPTQLRFLSVAIIVSGVATLVGWHTRWAAAVLAVAFSWLEFIEVTTYLNHYWLISSMAALLAVVPAGAEFSLDARRRGRTSVPVWSVWALRFQVGVVYISAGIAKLSTDWLVNSLPLRLWLPARSDLPIVGDLLALPATASAASWAGAVFDLGVVWFLLHRRTRPWAWGAVVTFHVVTWMLFPSIGIFPWVMILVSTIFFSPDWPRRLLRRGEQRAASLKVASRWLPVAAVLVLVQILLPLRSLVPDSRSTWTGEDFRFAWNVLAVEKTGFLRFRVTGDEGEEVVDPARWFSDNQMRILPTEPRLIVQAAHIIAQDWVGDVEVHAESWMSVNGRTERMLIDPNIDLVAVPVGAPPERVVGWPG